MPALVNRMIVTHGAECHKLVAGEEGISCSWVDELCTQQEEVDTRILLHASHASSGGHDCIIIKSPDTDARLYQTRYWPYSYMWIRLFPAYFLLILQK